MSLHRGCSSAAAQQLPLPHRPNSRRRRTESPHSLRALRLAERPRRQTSVNGGVHVPRRQTECRPYRRRLRRSQSFLPFPARGPRNGGEERTSRDSLSSVSKARPHADTEQLFAIGQELGFVAHAAEVIHAGAEHVAGLSPPKPPRFGDDISAEVVFLPEMPVDGHERRALPAGTAGRTVLDAELELPRFSAASD